MDDYSVLQEYPLESNFLDLIPAKAQKGLSTFDLEFTCLDADGSYIVIGSNIGVVYLFNREKGYLHRLKDNEHRVSVTCVKVLISLECLVAFGCRDGAVLVYKVPFHQNAELEKFTVEGLHSCAITSLEWARNGMKFFSGDESGVVVCTEIDHLEHLSRSKILVKESTKVVQLSYKHQILVISTLLRSLIYCMKTNTTLQIGQKERKCYGPFGAVIFESNNTSSVFASRPGQRLWKSDMSGIIQETMIFKNVLMTSQPTIQTLIKNNENPCFTDFPFERLLQFNSSVLICCESYILLIDPISKSIVATSPKLDPIIDVAVCNKEIFILRGIRHILRISSEPDENSGVTVADEPTLFEEILEPLKGLTTYVKERSDSLSVQIDKNPTIFDWLKKKRSASTPVELPSNVVFDNTGEITSPGSKPLPDIVNLNINEIVPVQLNELPAVMIETSELITKDLSKLDVSEDIVFKVKKKNKKHKKVHFDIDSAPKRERHKFKPSTEPTIIGPSNIRTDLSRQKILNNNLEQSNNNESNKNETSASNVLDINTNENTLGISVAPENSIPINLSSSVAVENNTITSSDCVDSTPSNNNQLSKSNKDADRETGNISSTFSHLENQDLSNGNSDNYSSNENIYAYIETELSVANESNNNNAPSLTLNTNETLIKKNSENSSEKISDADEFYSSLLNTKCNYPDAQKAENREDLSDSISIEESFTTSSLSSKKDDPPKYGVDWVEYKAPELLLDLSVSNDHVFCVDIRNQLYFSKLPTLGLLKWIELGQMAEKIVASNSESVVWALYKGTIYAARQMADYLWQNTEWISIARDVVSIAVDDTCGWYVKLNGTLITQQYLTASNPLSYPQTVSCDAFVVQVAFKDGVLWVLTKSGAILTNKAQGLEISISKWKEIMLDNIPGVDGIFLGPQKTGWIVDSSGMIRFKIGVTPETPDGTGEPWIVEASNYLLRVTTQLEQVVRRALSSDVLTNLIRGKQHLCFSASDYGVWFCKTYDNLLYSNQKSIIGHMWEQVIPPSTVAATKWSLVAAEGIINSEGALWCVNSNKELFCYDIKTSNLLPVELPSTSTICCLQPKYQSLWLLSENGDIFIRRGITSKCLQGIWWQALDLLQLESQKIIHISCSSFVTWACTSDGELLMRLGSLNPSSTKLNQAWISVGTPNEEATSPLVKLSSIGKRFPLPLLPSHSCEDGFSKVYVGPSGYPVWAVDRRQCVYAREGATPNLPIGEKWTSIPELYAKTLCVTNDAVWLLESCGKIYRRFGITEKNTCGDYWKQMPGNFDCLSATEDDDLWGIQNGSMFCHFSFVLYNVEDANKKTTARMISEDDWEDIMEDFDDTI